ncbi:hypothetical protein JZ751_014677 [Albula glossodonta]|uniref:Uncharacterized protein n=1 Tax=Albula glossodonta TaxID=121402 RepID=A0A8T2MW45_9TELE|nr:hypothetical protein JZ751_014677 [Albula glossodonta]
MISGGMHVTKAWPKQSWRFSTTYLLYSEDHESHQGGDMEETSGIQDLLLFCLAGSSEVAD